jgi:hypothetical protein
MSGVPERRYPTMVRSRTLSATAVSMLRAKVPVLGNTPVKVPLTAGSVGEARPLRSSDVAGVAQLFQKTFRNPRKPALPALAACIEQIFLDHPWQDKECVSKVILDSNGAVAGFIGVLPQRLHYGDTIVRASVLGSLMSNEPQKNPLVGARLSEGISVESKIMETSAAVPNAVALSTAFCSSVVPRRPTSRDNPRASMTAATA